MKACSATPPANASIPGRDPFSAWGWLVCCLLLCLTGCQTEGEFPNRPITLICPWSAGGGTDRVSRQMAALLEAELGTPVNVINATGGAGVTGHSRGALARPDGYTLTMLTVELNMLHWRGLTNVTPENFAPLMLLNQDSAALFVGQDSPYQSLDDLEQALRESPGSLKASGTAQGGVWHVALAGWLLQRNLPATAANWISINGAGPSLQELTAGGIDMVCCSLPEADALLTGGQVRCLGIMAEQRDPGYPQVPTFSEQGHPWSLAGWRGLAAPQGTPPERLQRLTTAMQIVTQSDAFRAFMQQSGFNLALQGPDQFAETLAEQDRLFEEILLSKAFASVSDERFGPMIFPGVIGCLLMLICIPVVWQSWQPTSQHPSTETEPAVGSGGESDSAARARSGWESVLSVLLAAILFLLVLEPFGYVLASWLLLAGLMRYLGVRWSVVLLVALLVSLASYQVFGVWLRVPLPRGMMGW